MPMRPSHGVLVVRLAVYGAVALLAVIVLLLRAERARPDRPAGNDVLRGRMFDGQANRAIVTIHDGEVREVIVHVGDICPGDGRGAEMRFDDTGLGFGRDGRRFSGARFIEYPPDASGWQPRMTVSVEGELAEDHRAARGTVTGSLAWRRNGVAGATCGPRTIRWEALTRKDRG